MYCRRSQKSIGVATRIGNEEQKITKKVMAERMKISRSQLDRLLDPEKTGVSLETMQRAAFVVGRELRVDLV